MAATNVVPFKWDKMLVMLAGGAAVITGVVLKNGYSNQAGKKGFKLPGIIAFVVGWVVVALALFTTQNFKFAWHSARSYLGGVAAAGVLGSAMLMMYFKQNGKTIPWWAVLLFSACWLVIGGSVGLTYDNKFRLGRFFAGLSIPALVLGAMLYVLPKIERKRKITDGFGMPMFSVAWVLLALLTSM